MGARLWSLCLCIRLSALSRLNRLSYGPGRDIAFDNISEEFEGQGRRSKVAILKNVIFGHFFFWCDLCRLDIAFLL